MENEIYLDLMFSATVYYNECDSRLLPGGVVSKSYVRTVKLIGLPDTTTLSELYVLGENAIVRNSNTDRYSYRIQNIEVCKEN
jgi:hypothetical protein